MGKKTINLYLGLRINTASVQDVCIKSEKILNELDKNNLNIKLAWNFACCPLLEENTKEMDNLLIEIKTRIKAKNDTVIPIGYTGALHPFLNVDEIKKELRWSIHNEQGTGIKDIFNISPDILFPVIPELNRKEIMQVYKETGFSYIGIPQKQVHINPFNIKNDTPVNLISFIEYYNYADFQFSSKLKRIFRQQENNLIIMLCFRPSFYENKDEFDLSVLTLLNTIEKYFNINFCSFESINNISADSYKELSFYDLPSYPDIRRRGLNAVKYRKKDNTYKDVLNIFNPLLTIKTNKEPKPLKNSFHNSRQNVSSMHGDIILYGNNFTVHFSNGQFSGITKKGKEITVRKKSKSYITVSGRKHKYRLLNAFSIEGERTRGLRSSLAVKIGKYDFNFQSDYIFIDDFPYLIVASYIDYPNIENNSVLEQIVPIEIPLFYFDGNVEIFSIFPDKSKSNYFISQKSDYVVATGSTFFFKNNDTGIVFGYPKDKAPSISTCQIKIKRERKKYLLSINPFGSYIYNDMEYFRNKKEIFSFYLGISEYCPKSIPVFPDYVLDEIPMGSVSD
jgi:hypothetical protein